MAALTAFIIQPGVGCQKLTLLQTVLHSGYRYGLKKLADVDSLLNSTATALETISQAISPTYAIAEVARAMALMWPDFRRSGWEGDYIAAFEAAEYLVEKS